ncbi:MAG TPA: cytochrome C oxidase subunit IV family protein [Pyrinomonadaceae bacterium]|jgi:cytochrome c oxidase subunit 4
MSEHIVSRTVYFVIFGALLVLTFLTVVAANFDFGAMNDVVAMTIAVAKAMLVILFFMHVRYSSRLIWVVVAGAFFWLGILLVLTMADYLSRGWFGTKPAELPRERSRIERVYPPVHPNKAPAGLFEVSSLN